MIKVGRTFLRVVFIGFILVFAAVKIFDIESRESLKEKRIRHIDNTTSEFDEPW